MHLAILYNCAYGLSIFTSQTVDKETFHNIFLFQINLDEAGEDCFLIEPRDLLGFMYWDSVTPVSYRWDSTAPLWIAFTTIDWRIGPPAPGDIVEFDYLKFPWRFAMSAEYDITKYCLDGLVHDFL